jgi:hypothetical protein
MMSKNTAFKVTNESSQAERRAVAANDRRVHKGGTYHQFAASEAGAVGGRFAAESKQRVVGSGPVAYPQLPETSPWHNDPVPAEEPLGVDINMVEAVGTYAEIEKSLAESQSGEGINQASPPNGLPNDEGRAPLGSNSLPRRSSRPRRVSKKGRASHA